MARMRELEFRAWWKDTKRFLDCDEWYMTCSGAKYLHYAVMPYKDDNFIIEQYTGLKDKNGQKIYEGDIVTFLVERFNNVTLGFESEDWHTAVVEWNQDDACYSFMVRDVPFSVRYEAEVIGNIHENQELLEIKNEI